MNIIYKMTRKMLKLNKMRTLVTIIGIMLSAAMFTAVVSTITSFQNYMLRYEERNAGSYYAHTSGINYDDMKKLVSKDKVKSYVTMENLGFADIKSQNKYKPYLCIEGVQKNFTDLVAVNILEGRMPESDEEILIPRHLVTNGCVRDIKVGDTITLNVGIRKNGDMKVYTNILLQTDDNDEKCEELVDTRERSYVVSGFYERPVFESYDAAGYTALTISDENQSGVYDVFYQTDKVKDIYIFVQDNDYAELTEYNRSYLMYKGASVNDGANDMLYGMGIILGLIIMIGSISLIYNAFSISVSERTKQFGILKSVGATTRQMFKSVIYEGMTLSIIGIPLGIICGIGGMFVTFKAVSGIFDEMVPVETGDVKLKLYVTWWAVVTAAVVCLITVIISAVIPAFKAAKKPAIAAIRQSDDIRLKGRRLKTSSLTLRLFGFEGMLASKNYKRNRKKYRATVMSLFVSIVLFISAAAFCGYFKKALEITADSKNFDLYYSYTSDIDINKTSEKEKKNNVNNVREILENGKGIKEITSIQGGIIFTSKLTRDMTDYYDVLKNFSFDGEEVRLSISPQFIQDDKYLEYLNEQGYDEKTYMDTENPTAIGYTYMKYYDDKYMEGDVIHHDINKIALSDFDPEYYEVENHKKHDKKILKIGTYAEKDDVPVGIDQTNTSCNLILMYPLSAAEKVLGKENMKFVSGTMEFYMTAEDSRAAYEDIQNVLFEAGYDTTTLSDEQKNERSSRALITVMNIFSYGFIILISLISVANVFNTISTNVGLRRREFAMLKSVGMSPRGFNRLMNFECLLYGAKGIMYGIPVSIIICVMMHDAMDEIFSKNIR